ncbi:LCP family protein [Lentzea sp. NPDC059081]|uniref:LCP family protein n=1 Tax=Lentzea sp. NPDC059081 TaxID=3346719 RepID=UPI0036B6C959
MNDLIRRAIAAEAEERVDPRTVQAGLRKAEKRTRPWGMIVGVATLTAAAAAAAVIVPTAIKKTDVSPAAQTAPATDQTVLLIGEDDAGSTDALMLARFPADGRSVLVVSLPSDVLVDGGKINGLFAQDPAKLTAAVERATGTKVDHHAAVKMSEFGKISQVIGGVEVCLKADTTDPATRTRFPAGRQTLAGDGALAFLRQRQGLPHGDLDRVRRQQMFLVGLASQVTKDKALALAREASGAIKVDAGWDVLDFAQRFTGAMGISVTTLPVGEPLYRENGFAYEADPAKSKEFVDKALQGRDSSGGGSCVN